MSTCFSSQEICAEPQLVALALALGARQTPGWSAAEESLAQHLPPMDPRLVEDVRQRALGGADPLGTLFCALRSPELRRASGATYTPEPIVEAMLRWAAGQGQPARVVDPGAGSGRFIVSAGKRFPRAALVAIEMDPLAALLARANLALAGMAQRSRVFVADYREAELPTIEERTLFIGNPPYVRHHLLGTTWKDWLVRTASKYGLGASQLAGLHVHFFLATLESARRDDFGIFITAAEWLDVNYGQLVRNLVLGPLGGKTVHVIEPKAAPFPDAATTAAITGFQVGARPRSIRLKRVESLHSLGDLAGGRPVVRERLEAATRWTPLTRPARKGPSGHVELGELCRVHRGQVTGANKIWIAGAHSDGLPGSVLFASITKARELFCAGSALRDSTGLRQVIDLPIDLDALGRDVLPSVKRFLKWARSQGASDGFIARNRKVWWAVGLREPAPILATYMARRPPAFVVNAAGARHINIAHGIYPREPLSARVLSALAAYLSKSITLAEGRTYAGGLTKFEPKEMERLLVPGPDSLAACDAVARS